MKFIFLIVVAFLLLIKCNQETNKTIRIAGEAQGTTWQITWLSENNLNLKEAIDSIFKRIDLSLSTYVPSPIPSP